MGGRDQFPWCAKGRATLSVRSTRTPCQQVEARTDSRGRYVRADDRYTYTPRATHTRVGRRERKRDARRTHTT